MAAHEVPGSASAARNHGRTWLQGEPGTHQLEIARDDRAALLRVVREVGEVPVGHERAVAGTLGVERGVAVVRVADEVVAEPARGRAGWSSSI
jgi:hypothetical protein